MEGWMTAAVTVLGIFACLGNRFAQTAVQMLATVMLCMLAGYGVGCRLCANAVQVTALCAACGAAALLLCMAYARLVRVGAALGLLAFGIRLSGLAIFVPALPFVLAVRSGRCLLQTAESCAVVVIGCFELLSPIHGQSFLFSFDAVSPSLSLYLLACTLLLIPMSRWLSAAFVNPAAGDI